MAMQTIKMGGIVSDEITKINANFSEIENDYAKSADIPSATSDLTNDSGYITSAALPTKTSDLTNDSGFVTSSAVPTKTSDLTNDSNFITSAQIPTIPTKLSQLTNDANYVKTTDAAITNKVDKVAGMGLSENNYTSAEKNKLAGLNAPAQIAFSTSDFGAAASDGYVYATKAITSGTPVAVFRANGSNYDRVIANLEVQGSNVVIGASEAFAGYVLCV